MSSILLSTAYLPNIQYLRALAQNGGAMVEQWESFGKQSFRNRCQILAESGPMSLSIPVVKAGSKQFTKDVRISYQENWQAKHWHAIESAYGSSPYFEYFRSDFEVFYTNRYEYLLDFNTGLTSLIIGLLGIKASMMPTEKYVSADMAGSMGIADLRDIIHPKRQQRDGQFYYTSQSYPQVFDCRMPFAPNMSGLDIVFNIGEEARWYLLDKGRRQGAIFEC